jgi:hypothetical protein
MSDAALVPALKPSLRAVARAATTGRREKRVERRETLFELIVSGYGYDQVAAKLNLSVSAVRREVNHVLALRAMDAPQRYVGLQLARLNKALLVTDVAMEQGDLRSIPALIKVMGELDRYHGLAARLESQLQAAKEAALPAPALENSEPPKVAQIGA